MMCATGSASFGSGYVMIQEMCVRYVRRILVLCTFHDVLKRSPNPCLSCRFAGFEKGETCMNGHVMTFSICHLDISSSNIVPRVYGSVIYGSTEKGAYLVIAELSTGSLRGWVLIHSHQRCMWIFRKSAQRRPWRLPS